MSKFPTIGVCALLAAAGVAPVHGDASTRARPDVHASETAWTAVAKETHGFVSSSYRLRSNEHGEDNDLRNTLGFDAFEGRTVSMHFLGDQSIDLDGRRDNDGYYVFDSLADSQHNSLDNRVLSAYADINKTCRTERIRLGRQLVDGTPMEADLDGVSVQSLKLGPAGLGAGAYGGLPVRHYGSMSNDTVFGAYLEAVPLRDLDARLDWMRARDDRQAAGVRRDDLYGASVGYRILRDLSARARYTAMGHEARDLDLRTIYANPGHDLTVTVSGYTLFAAETDAALEFNPFYTAMHTLYPYYKLGIAASKGFTEVLRVDIGGDMRRVKDSRDEGQYNREYDRLYLSPSLIGLPWKGAETTLRLDWWDSGARDVLSVGGDVSHACTAKLKVSVGSEYSRYKYDLYSDTEREDVQSYYVKARYKLSKALRLDSSYELDDDDLEIYHVLKLGITCGF